MSDRPKGFTTRALHAAQDEQVRQHPLAPPLYQAATFSFDELDDFASVAQTKISGGYLYSRWGNPTVERLGRMVGALEGAEATACLASGMAAIYAALQSVTREGDHIVAASQLYGGTHGLLAKVLPAAGVTATRVDVTDHVAIEAAFTPATKVLYAETIGNPTLPVADVPVLADIAHAHGALLIVDATFTPPPLLRPIEHGADIVVHSATKYLSGHGDVIAGVASGSAERVAAIRELVMDTGGILAPFEAWLCARGIETLALRVERISANAATLARTLEDGGAVAAVHYPGLESHPGHDLAKRLLGDRFGGMLSFDAGSFDAGRRFLERVRIAKRAASLGATRTLVVHPASVTHTQLTPEERAAAGITEGMVRVAVGIEDIEDLIEDFTQALS